MAKSATHTQIYRALIDVLETKPYHRTNLIEKSVIKLGLTDEERNDNSVGSVHNNLRSKIGTVINELHARELIGLDDGGRYFLVSAKPVIIRIEKCESEILKALTKSPLTKSELRDLLKSVFGTDKTATTRDDDTLSTYMGQILKRFIAEGAVIIENGYYKLSPRLTARADNINALLSLKSEFIAKIHSNGGEFFENYFMKLLKKYFEKQGKKILECYVTGGTRDGGIDGVIVTEDSLGFKETTMVQTKNRVDIPNETDVRGFYGAVCAKDGSRGIYATISDFHTGAKEFLDSIDNCVGINGDRIFSMAIECSYGIKKHDGELQIDSKVI